jgi:ferredoxin, 2Fe-2S
MAEARTGDTLLDAALDAGIELPHECGGNCTCTTCHVRIIAGGEHLSPMEPPEDERLESTPLRDWRSRLACQAILCGGAVRAEILFDRTGLQE